MLSLTLQAQKNKKTRDVPEWGQVDKSELLSKECEFDKAAEAVVLFQVGDLICTVTGDIELDFHVRIKILKEKGLERANVHLPYYSYKNEESIRKLTAQTFNLDAAGNVVSTPVDKKSIYVKPINNRISEQIFSFPEAKIGSIIEYKYTLTGAGLRNWYFQNEIPVAYSRYKLDFPYEVELNSTPYCVLQFESAQETKGDRVIKTYSMKNVPALRDEPYISCDDDYLQRIETRLIAVNAAGQRVNLVRSWPGIIKQLMEDEDFGIQLKRNIPRTADLDAELNQITDPYKKMVTIHNYVKKNMEWDGQNSIWAIGGVRSAWKDKKGTAGEINLILVNLLKDAGLDAQPVLVSTRDNGRIMTSIAGFTQFNKVLAYVELGGEVYVLDGTDKYTPSKLIPYNVMYSEGLVINKLETMEWGWKGLWKEKDLKKNVVFFKAEITEQGEMKGEASVNSFDYERVERIPALQKGKDKFIEEYITDPNPDVKVENFEIENEKVDTLPLVQKFKFTKPVNSSGDYKYFSTNIFTGLENNPFVSDMRFSDVFFGTNQFYNIVAAITIPEGYTFEELPKNVRMIMPDTSISVARIIAAEKNQLSMRLTLEFKKPYYTTEEYSYFKEFYKKLMDILNEQFVIKKKANP